MSGLDKLKDLKNKCIMCKSDSYSVCQRCGDYYCSKKCQRKDWQRHRYICYAIPFYNPFLLEDKTKLGQPEKSNKTSDTPSVSNSKISSKIIHDLKSEIIIPITNPLHPDKRSRKRQIEEAAESSSKGTGKETCLPNNAYLGPEEREFKRMREDDGKYSYKRNVLAQVNVQKIEKEPKLVEKPKEHSRVIITGFRSPNICYVRSANPESNMGYKDLIAKVNDYGLVASKLRGYPKAFTYVITKFKGKMFRAKVLSVRSYHAIRVLMIDTGHTAFRSLKDMYEISDEIVSMPLYSVQVNLQRVENYALKDKMMALLTKYENNEFKIIYCDNDENVPNVLLYSWQSHECINDKIIDIGGSVGVYSKYEHFRAN